MPEGGWGLPQGVGEKDHGEREGVVAAVPVVPELFSCFEQPEREIGEEVEVHEPRHPFDLSEDDIAFRVVAQASGAVVAQAHEHPPEQLAIVGSQVTRQPAQVPDRQLPDAFPYRKFVRVVYHGQGELLDAQGFGAVESKSEHAPVFRTDDRGQHREQSDYFRDVQRFVGLVTELARPWMELVPSPGTPVENDIKVTAGETAFACLPARYRALRRVRAPDTGSWPVGYPDNRHGVVDVQDGRAVPGHVVVFESTEEAFQ